MEAWLAAALDYLPRWLDFQMRRSEVPGCVLAVAHRGEVVLEAVFGVADVGTAERLTPRHRFRVASHSKSFTAAGIMKLREAGRLKLDDRAGQYVDGLHPAIADTTIAQLLSHSAGIVRDGADAGQWQDRRTFLDEAELRAALNEPPTIAPNTRFKYSNHAFGLAGLVIAAVTGETYTNWIRREIIAASGLDETEPDMPIAPRLPMARGHSAMLPLGHRVVVPGDNPTHALAAATGFVSTAADLVRFFSRLDPEATDSVLSVASRREMTRRQWRDPATTVERHYGLGLFIGCTAETDWYGHSGGFQGFISQTVVMPQHAVGVSLVTNTVERYANSWAEGAIRIIAACADRGAPEPAIADWTGRWWNLWGAFDLVPLGNRVLVAVPALLDPLADAAEIEVRNPDAGRIVSDSGSGHHGEPVRRIRAADEAVAGVWLGGTFLVPEAEILGEMKARYGRRSAAAGGATPL